MAPNGREVNKGQHTKVVCNWERDNLSHVMRKPVYAICEQQRRRSVCAAAVVRCPDSIIHLLAKAEISRP